MFVKNKIIDENKIREAIECRNQITEESLRKEWEDVCELSKEIGTSQIGSEEVKFFESYDIAFSVSLMCLSLDEVEFISDNNLLELEENNLLDYCWKMSINRRINDYRQTLIDLNNSMQKENIGSYFQRFPNLWKMNIQASKIIIILGLDRENVELTPNGEKLKMCVDNIKKIFLESVTHDLDSNSKKR